MTAYLYPAPDGPVLRYPNTPEPYIAAVVFQTFLYGLYLVLFCGSLVVLGRRPRQRWVLLATTMIMFSIATADMGYTYYLLFGNLFKHGLTYGSLRPIYIMYVTNSVIADSLLLYRCYLVWGSKRRAVVVPAVLLILATGCGYTFEGTSLSLSRFSWINLSLTVTLNIILTSMTVGRICWILKNARGLLREDMARRYHNSVAVIVESGVIYTVYASLDLVFRNNRTGNTILDAGLTQIVGIMPTLIIVQIGLANPPQPHHTTTPIQHIQEREASNTMCLSEISKISVV
ncbi:hypothetical protein Hypma_005370 [Hypsizygus marmoreus]|uniref:Uncharacterized protein n=1 Tax=Hypsizygus marmoreus TaxID=39966 RepID=A0A369JZI7_HYPMA|nr:hypothetical protein Hypma_005370 [Hypsizygus marmoreus]